MPMDLLAYRFTDGLQTKYESPEIRKAIIMKILVFNCGSSSLKYRLISMPEERELAAGEAQRIGPRTAEPPRIVHRPADGEEEIYQENMSDHGEAFMRVMNLLVRESDSRPDAAGHRVVHGGSIFARHAMVDDTVMNNLEPLNRMAPLHNPPAVALVKACQELYPKLPQALVFDTAFHATIPEAARTYAIPRPLAEEMGIRKYGFHGISHEYVTSEAAKYLEIPLEEFDAVSCHLGSGGASLCAVSAGRSVENTMGFSPLQGLVMSTRSGDLDPGIAMHLLSRADGDCEEVENLLNRKSGVLGMSGMSADIRDVLRSASEGEDSERMNWSSQVYLWRIRKYLGAYMALVGARAVIFTDTIGELVPEARWAVCAGLESFGLTIAPVKNSEAKDLPVDIATDKSPVRALVIQTNEEISIARSSFNLLDNQMRSESKEVLN